MTGTLVDPEAADTATTVMNTAKATNSQSMTFTTMFAVFLIFFLVASSILSLPYAIMGGCLPTGCDGVPPFALPLAKCLRFRPARGFISPARFEIKVCDYV